jgi:hypothetical protein
VQVVPAVGVGDQPDTAGRRTGQHPAVPLEPQVPRTVEREHRGEVATRQPGHVVVHLDLDRMVLLRRQPVRRPRRHAAAVVLDPDPDHAGRG